MKSLKTCFALQCHLLDKLLSLAIGILECDKFIKLLINVFAMSAKSFHCNVIIFINKCCRKLELSDVTLASACVLYHQFFTHCSTKDYDAYTIATTAIYLATKVEEEHIRLRDIVNVCHRTRHPEKPYLELDSEFWKLRDTIAYCELLIMRVLQFQVTYVHPHKYLLHYLLSLSQIFSKRVWSRSYVSDVAWSVLKDSYLDASCLNYLPQVHAIAAIDLALQSCKMEVPFESCSEVPWWKVLYQNCSYSDIVCVQSKIISTYSLLEKQAAKQT